MGFFDKGASAENYIETGYHYEKLSEKQQEAYRLSIQAILSWQKKLTLNTAFSKEEINRILSAVINDHPEIFWLNPNAFGISQGMGRSSLTFEYIYDKKEMAVKKARMKEQAEFIIDQNIDDVMTDYEKCLALHDYLTDNIRYNFSAMSVNYVYDAFTIEGSILKHQAVCAGIAKGLSYLLSMLGIPNIIVEGSSKIDGENVGHAWNMVKFGAHYYHIDATWDLQEINHFSNRSHMFFALDDESILDNHTWELNDYPTCDALEYNYYVKKKQYFRSFRSFELYLQKFLKGKRKYMDVRFEDTLDFSEGGSRKVMKLIEKNASYVDVGYQISYLFHDATNVFQADFTYV